MYNSAKFIPLFISDADSATGSRLGGLPPKGVFPKYLSPLTKYLSTISIDGENEVSIFTSFDFENGGENDPLDNFGNLFDEENPLVEAVFHNLSEREVKSDIPSDLPGRRIDIINLDLGGSDELKLFSEFHKIGGKPYFSHQHHNLFYEACEKLLDEDYTQLVQLAFPVGPYDSVIDADWPFGEYLFHLFAKRVKGEWHYKYCWG